MCRRTWRRWRDAASRGRAHADAPAAADRETRAEAEAETSSDHVVWKLNVRGGQAVLNLSSRDGVRWSLLVLDYPGLKYPVRFSFMASRMNGEPIPTPRNVAAAIASVYVQPRDPENRQRPDLHHIAGRAEIPFSTVTSRVGKPWHHGKVELARLSSEGGFDILILDWQPDAETTDDATCEPVRYSVRVTDLDGRFILMRRSTVRESVIVYLIAMGRNPLSRRRAETASDHHPIDRSPAGADGD